MTESQFAILKVAECAPDTPALSRMDNHHGLVQKGVELIAEEEKNIGGQLGRPSGARYRAYTRLKQYVDDVKDTLFDTTTLNKAIQEIYTYPLRQSATDTLNRQLRSGISDEELAQLVLDLREDGRLCRIEDDEQSRIGQPSIICSMGLAVPKADD